jgi:hypothetical protein
MRTLSRQALLALADRDEDVAVSIFLPTQGAVGPDQRQDGTRLRNLLRLAEQQLSAAGMSNRRANRLLAPAAELTGQPAFRWAPHGGLALFLAEGMARRLELPYQPRELLVVGRRFHVKPLLPLLSGNGRFHLLALSQGRVRLFKGDRSGLEGVDLPGVPVNLDEAMRLDDRQEQLQLHETGPARPGSRPAAVFHGHGIGSDDAKDRILRFFREVDRGVQAAVGDASAPLLLAAVDYLVPIYRQASTHPHLLESSVCCNPDRLDAAALHRRAWAVVGEGFHRRQRLAAAHWRELAGTGLAISDLGQVVLAALAGRVETLLVPMDGERWGIADPTSGTLEVHQRGRPGDIGLLDLAMVETLRHRGSAYPLDPADQPDSDQPAALLRYAPGQSRAGGAQS